MRRTDHTTACDNRGGPAGYRVATSAAITWIVAITLIFGVTLGTTSIGNQTALYTQVTADQTGAASGLFRTFGYLGSIASSVITGIVFHTSVTDHDLHDIAAIMIAVSAVALLFTLADRQLRTQPRTVPASAPAVSSSPPSATPTTATTRSSSSPTPVPTPIRTCIPSSRRGSSRGKRT